MLVGINLTAARTRAAMAVVFAAFRIIVPRVNALCSVWDCWLLLSSGTALLLLCSSVCLGMWPSDLTSCYTFA